MKKTNIRGRAICVIIYRSRPACAHLLIARRRHRSLFAPRLADSATSFLQGCRSQQNSWGRNTATNGVAHSDMNMNWRPIKDGHYFVVWWRNKIPLVSVVRPIIQQNALIRLVRLPVRLKSSANASYVRMKSPLEECSEFTNRLLIWHLFCWGHLVII